MAKIDFSELEDYMLKMDDLANIPTSVISDMVEAGAAVVKTEQAKYADSMLRGGGHDRKTGRTVNYSTGTTAKVIKPKSVEKNSDGVSVEITFSGNRKRNGSSTRNAEIAFINEYGKKNQPARPFIKLANEKCGEALVQQMDYVLGQYYKSIGMG